MVSRHSNEGENPDGSEKEYYKSHGIGLLRGGINTKVHAVVDGPSNPVEFLLSPGNDHDANHAIKLLDKVYLLDSHVLEDSAYGTAEIRDHIESRQAAYVIPPKSNSLNPWDCGWWRYKERHLVECFFQKLIGSVVFHPNMRSPTILSFPIFTLLPLPFWSNNLNNAIFQTSTIQFEAKNS